MKPLSFGETSTGKKVKAQLFDEDGSRNVFIAGVKGCGKSTLMKNLALQVADTGAHVYVIDISATPVPEYRRLADKIGLRNMSLLENGDHDVVHMDSDNACNKGMLFSDITGVYRESVAKQIIAALDMIREESRSHDGNSVLLLDECWRVKDETGDVGEALTELIEDLNDDNCSVWMSSQNPSDLSLNPILLEKAHVNVYMALSLSERQLLATEGRLSLSASDPLDETKAFSGNFILSCKGGIHELATVGLDDTGKYVADTSWDALCGEE